MIVGAVVGGLAGALLLNLAYFVGVALIGAAAGALLLHAIWARFATGDPHVGLVVAVRGARRGDRHEPAALGDHPGHRVRRRVDADRRRVSADGRPCGEGRRRDQGRVGLLSPEPRAGPPLAARRLGWSSASPASIVQSSGEGEGEALA